MADIFKTKESRPIPLRSYALGVAILWSMLISISLVWNLKIEKNGTLETARIEARTVFEKDVIYRRWNVMHSGVYAPVTEMTRSNPYLNVPERDITTPSGKKLTKINPAYMIRQVNEIAIKTYSVKGHLTSLDPIRPANAPDPWESRALKAFQTGLKEVSSVEEMEGENYMRLMNPILTEKGCLKCHSEQGYKVGDILGGISVSVPMAPLMAIERSNIIALSGGHGLLWLAGLLVIGLGNRRLCTQLHKRIEAEKALEKARDELEQRVEERTSELVETNKELKQLIKKREQAERKLLVHQERLRALSSELSLTEERERRRFATELHDGIGQNLALSLNTINTLRDAPDFANLSTAMNKITRLLEETIQGTRALTMKLSPPILYDLGFGAAVEELVDEFRELHGLEIVMDYDEKAKPVDVDLDAFLYRATRELLINVVKHAEVSRARISIEQKSDKIAEVVEDDGVGFDISKLSSGVSAKARGFGLLSIRERIRHLGGVFEVESQPGHGSSVRFSVPLKL